MSAVAPWHQIHPIPRGWLSENILAARLGEDFSLDIPFHRTGFVESAVNQVMSKRMAKKQQMQWSRRGAHLLLQVRTEVLNEDLEECFRAWYPGFRPQPQKATA
jgi:hypothetical protein